MGVPDTFHFLCTGAPKKEVYFMAIIDILTPYDAKKKAAHAAKTVKHGVSSQSSSGAQPCGVRLYPPPSAWRVVLASCSGNVSAPSFPLEKMSLAAFPCAPCFPASFPAWPGNKHVLFFPGVVWPLGRAASSVPLGTAGTLGLLLESRE